MFPMRHAVVRRRPLLRAAVVGGGAYAAGRAAATHPAEQADQEVRPDAGLVDQLNELSAMHERGALTDEEFTAAKARLLGLRPHRSCSRRPRATASRLDVTPSLW
jgi:hypothetical protein